MLFGKKKETSGDDLYKKMYGRLEEMHKMDMEKTGGGLLAESCRAGMDMLDVLKLRGVKDSSVVGTLMFLSAIGADEAGKSRSDLKKLVDQAPLP